MVSLGVMVLAVPALAVCYRLPFGNPNLADGFGSTCCGRTNPHRGVDFPQASGTAIPVIGDGTIVLRTTSSCLGNVVVVQHDDGMFSGYSHMLIQSPLAVGTRVRMGDIIGKVGSTGTCTTGPHLHLSISPTIGGYGSGTVYDPYAFIQARLVCSCDRSGGDFTFSCDGPNTGLHCVNVNEPGDPDSWSDNFLCSGTDWGVQWSSSGPIEGMQCANVTEAAEPHATEWSDDFVCVPPQSPIKVAWSSAGPIAGQSCVQWNEPGDPHSWADNHLCTSQEARFSNGPFTFSGNGAPAGLDCANVDEPSDPQTWNDNFFCSAPEWKLGMKWSFAGPLEGLDCTAVNESAEHVAAAWADNFLCVPKQAPFAFTFNSAGPIAGQTCTRWFEWADRAGSWDDNHLCAREVNDFSEGPLTFSADGPNDGQTCVAIEGDPAWTDDFLCSKELPGLKFSATGALANLDCTAVRSPLDDHGWADSFVCLPKGAPWGLTFSATGRLSGQSCVRFFERDDLAGGWIDAWLCARPLSESERTRGEVALAPPPLDPTARIEGSAQGCNAIDAQWLALTALLLLRRRR
ncbi:MAG: M23 family metallopeptidase [Archangium sp.]